MGDFAAEGGGVHPGKPIIWPTGKASSSPVSPSQEAQIAGGVRGVPPRAAPTKPSEVAPTQPTQPGAPAVPAKAAPSIVRPLTVEDIRSHLLKLQIEPNDFNTTIASKMLRNGLELSRTNFVNLMTLLQGTNKSQAMQEAALVMLMKGIDSPKAVQVLGQYFSENPGLATQTLALQEGLGNLISALGMGKGLMNANLVAQLGALLSQFEESFRNLTEKGSRINRGNMLNDVRALKALLSGVQDKAPTSDSAPAQALSSALMEFQGKLDGTMQNLLSQAILSQSGRSEVNYLYHQIPNAMTSPPKDFEIVVKRDGEGKDSHVDPRNTQVVMSMETEHMGKMVISMIVKDNKVYVIFVFSEKEYGAEGRSKIAKEFGEFQQKLADKNFLITGYQVKIDPAMCNIRPYLIPMLPGLEDLLRKIDIEA
ncbi:hypothetical protein A3H38_01040 [candidate division WOR-1 bacterium RIFCSPLOWO2_02_FULL_46_20]|uniref:Flagellar hook-length control protein-like C-terminal domain-containing protein n=2 Tax=Saganbacteria TaxID=1703751 RepID=A0A1F4RFL6_UNCSA|nr:MAG: hypothetical protein A3J44_01375 [candidate division WOR-1 bacterium RIFCSPHIGHO2_02_FULL_45_12]OGC06273.1 MAG: hypothetical protein A3H38_01040 [candidate division WOR-1 bacterium RIFCSPLOWO2_02_FULL_46_20]OGC08620.1 MAG: hypothetical protein A3F86_01115 [candidate division WOR-1 bacterium RIFCSPLOWO2_12_FULL_45_9]